MEIPTREPNPRIRGYRDLIAWQKARLLVRNVYAGTKTLPKEEIYGLTQQIRRAAVSVPSNIAEGFGRGSRGDYVRFLQMARGSLYELETQVTLAEDLGYFALKTSANLLALSEECSRILQGLIKSLTRDRKEE